MASYKVPQDVEADDKLIGPFSFRQFIYLIIVAMAIAMAWGLAQIFFGLAIIPVPIILLFGALALPLRKDQPMEIYLAAIISFFLKPRKRMWDPEGIESTIEITAPKVVEVKRTKDISGGEAVQRLNYLANLVDTQGWSIRGVQAGQNIAMNTDVILEAQGAEDILDTNTSVANKFGQMMQESTDRMRQEARERMMQASIAPEPVAAPPAQIQPPVQQPVMQAQEAVVAAYTQPIQPQPQPQPVQDPVITQPQTPQSVAQPPQPEVFIQPVFNPYPTIKQTVMQPLDTEDHIAEGSLPPKQEETPAPVEVTTSETPPSADIIELANNSELSVQTIAREASRLKKKSEDSDEVVISLR